MDLADYAVSVLISLATHSTFFGKQVNFEDCTYLMNNEDTLFVGALILKIMKIILVCESEVKSQIYLFNHFSFFFGLP